MAGMTMEELAGKIGEIVDKSVAPLKAELEAAKTAGQDTSKIEAAVKAAIEAGEKKKSAAANEWESLIEYSRINKDGSINIDSAKMLGQIAAGVGYAMESTHANSVRDKQMILDFTKKLYPESKALHAVMQKDMEAGIPSAGGYAVPQVMLTDLVPYLYARTIANKLGITKYPMPHGNLRIPRMDSTSAISWGGELPKSNKTQPVLGDVVLNSKKMTAIVPYSNTLFRQQQVGLDARISQDLQIKATIGADDALFYGLGNSYQPLGLENTSGIQVLGSTGSPTSLTPQFPIDMVALLEQANVPMLNPGWVMNPVAKAWMMGKAFASGPFAWANEMVTGDKTLNAIPYISSSTIKNSGSSPTWANIWLGDWSELVWGVSYDIAIDVSREGGYTDSAGTVHNAWQEDFTMVRLISEFDIGVKHPTSFIEAFVAKGS